MLQNRFILIAILLSATKLFSYPTTIAKGYRSCDTCHITPAGNSTLNDYGRSMASDFMASFSSEDEAREFLFADSRYLDYGIDYRHLAIQNTYRPLVNFPMLLDFDGAIHLDDKLTIAASMGFYGRDRKLESRESFAQYKLFQRTGIRVGYFMPILGINTNAHNLSIKKIMGLSRGSESYNIEMHHANKYFQVFYTASANSFTLKNDEKNLYRLSNPEGDRTHRLRFSMLYVKKLEVGANLLLSDNYKASGFFLKHSLFKNQYFFYEANRTKDEVSSWARLGLFLFNGFDTYIEMDESKNNFSNSRDVFIGIDWMVRPRIEISFKLNLTGDNSYYQTHLWM